MKLSAEQRVRFLLSAIPYYEERQYSGNYYDNDDLNDIIDAIERAPLTDKQRQVIQLTFIEDMTHKTASENMGVTKQAVQKHEQKAVTKIAEAYEKGKRNDFE